MARKFVLALLVAICSLSWSAYRSQAKAPEGAVVLRCYPVSDLAVWRHEGEKSVYDDRILVSYLTTAAKNESGLKIQSFEKNASLVVAATSTGHERISHAMNDLRAERK